LEAVLQRIAAELPALTEGSAELRNAHYNLQWLAGRWRQSRASARGGYFESHCA
jgi:hypothetical protein